jgi:hypothetical protein
MEEVAVTTKSLGMGFSFPPSVHQAAPFDQLALRAGRRGPSPICVHFRYWSDRIIKNLTTENTGRHGKRGKIKITNMIFVVN